MTPVCGCYLCTPEDQRDQRMIVCSICGHKRCPHATAHWHQCSGSNTPRQPGSRYNPGWVPPRERAEALGWVRDNSAWWRIRWTTGRGSTDSVVALYYQGLWAVHWSGRHVRYHATEDEALEHALLLLDVWLS